MDSTVHHIVMNDGSFDSGDIGPGGTSPTMRLNSAGGSYHCTIHPTTMFGSVNVSTDPTAPSPNPSPY
jgi:plastocyanin